MAAGTWTFTNGGRTKLLNGTFDIDTDTFKMALLQSTSNIGAASTTYAGLTNEVANGNGYTTGGQSITLTLSGTTTVTVDIDTDPMWTASGGSIVAMYAVIYEVGGNVLCYSLLDTTPANIEASDGYQMTITTHASGVFTLA
jgi:putative effector of murein hydrolase|tara:strand:- start:3439 stop:3864 length:426 start_codon:yes stop_codon:yes gene_type:complete